MGLIFWTWEMFVNIFINYWNVSSIRWQMQKQILTNWPFHIHVIFTIICFQQTSEWGYFKYYCSSYVVKSKNMPSKLSHSTQLLIALENAGRENSLVLDSLFRWDQCGLPCVQSLLQISPHFYHSYKLSQLDTFNASTICLSFPEI